MRRGPRGRQASLWYNVTCPDTGTYDTTAAGDPTYTKYDDVAAS